MSIASRLRRALRARVSRPKGGAARAAALALAACAALGLGLPARAATEKAASTAAPYKGIWVSTPFPAFSAPGGATVSLDLKVHNAGLPPQLVTLAVPDVPTGWRAAFIGDGKRVSSVFVAPDDHADVKLRLEPAAERAPAGAARSYHFEVVAKGSESDFTLPIDISFGNALPPRLTLTSDLPTLRGSPSSSFDFKVKVKNEGGSDATVRLDAVTPPGFQAKFTEEYGSQELTSFPLKGGDEKTISAKIDPPQSVKAGTYPIEVHAATGKTEAAIKLAMQVTGQPKLTVSGTGDRLSTQAFAGETTPVDVILTNTGTADARNIKLTASSPSGWAVKFMPAAIDDLAPGANQTVKADFTPAGKAIAGDYMVTVSANGEGVSSSSDFRTTVRTSTMWGIVGVLVIAAALIVLVLAVVRYGRR